MSEEERCICGLPFAKHESVQVAYGVVRRCPNSGTVFVRAPRRTVALKWEVQP